MHNIPLKCIGIEEKGKADETIEEGRVAKKHNYKRESAKWSNNHYCAKQLQQLRNNREKRMWQKWLDWQYILDMG